MTSDQGVIGEGARQARPFSAPSEKTQRVQNYGNFRSSLMRVFSAAKAFFSSGEGRTPKKDAEDGERGMMAEVAGTARDSHLPTKEKAMTTTFTLGSASAIKAAAVREACRRLGIEAFVVPREAPSGVRTQPVGREETRRGARNRALAAQRSFAGSFGIGVENGIVREHDRWYDLAAVVIIAPDGREHVTWSGAVLVPDAFVERAEERGFDRMTVGAAIAEAYGSAPDDPHAALTDGRRTRMEFLADAATAAVAAVLGLAPTEKGESIMKNEHRIEIGGIFRDLPVREVAPGVRVALFNILGDWELAEAAGKALVARIPAGVEALVMPDGKAVALLHVMGRESGLPTFVARKEKKPYMAEPVSRIAYRSITTDREQALFLSADDAVRLSGKKALIVDDVVSTGGTLDAMRSLMAAVGAEVAGVAAVLTEGGSRPDVDALGDLPLF